ncbi:MULTISPECIES: hypothetical protein [Providencia]|uniref:hypothetical protein n=1 Tax=Providencia TaxID=586 RepID=UPI0022B6A002|nr:hypothetical protein [Providencia sp. 21OH12SH02B-Prov]WBA57823.1 hypothetical protein O7C57_04360 [Providencia sp. 21OH12SH02B-Prov]
MSFATDCNHFSFIIIGDEISHYVNFKINLKYLTMKIFCKLVYTLSFLDFFFCLSAKKKHRNLGGASQKSLWTDRVNVQEVKKTVAKATKSGIPRQLANTTSQPQSQKFQSNQTL